MCASDAAPLSEPAKPKLLDQVRHRCRLRHLALSTEHSYVAWIRRFILFHHKRHPLEMGAQEVSRFLTELAVAGHVAASTQNQALSALLFLYREVLEKEFGWLEDVVRANKPKRLPTVFTPDEALAILGELTGVRWLMGVQLYGEGLRLMECLRLRVKDLDFERLQVVVRDGKGEKDRVLAALAEPVLRQFLKQQKRRGRLRRGDSRTIQRLLEHLRLKGVVPSLEPTVDKSPLAILEQQYRDYLGKERGLSSGTGVRYWGVVRQLLVNRFGQRSVCMQKLVAEDVSSFVLRHARSGNPKVTQLMVASLRSFCRFLFQTGVTKRDLTGVIPAVATWRLAVVTATVPDCTICGIDLPHARSWTGIAEGWTSSGSFPNSRRTWGMRT